MELLLYDVYRNFQPSGARTIGAAGSLVERFMSRGAPSRRYTYHCVGYRLWAFTRRPLGSYCSNRLHFSSL